MQAGTVTDRFIISLVFLLFYSRLKLIDAKIHLNSKTAQFYHIPQLTVNSISSLNIKIREEITLKELPNLVTLENAKRKKSRNRRENRWSMQMIEMSVVLD